MTLEPVLLDPRCVLLRGDSADLALPECSVDAIVTDPPAGISFMGKSWDGDKGGRDAWSAWLAGLLGPAVRALKPGGHAFVWALPRTSHWTARALELAGLEVRDVIYHGFGCLTADVEVLTPHGWVRGIDVREGDSVAQWDAASGAITCAAVQETFRAPWLGDLVRFKNTDTDQALTPDHRVYYRSMGWKLWSAYKVKAASEIGRASPIRLPLAGEHDGPGIGGEDYAALLGWVWTEGGFDHAPGTGVRIYQSSVNAPKVAEIDALLDRLGAHKRYSYERAHVSRKTGPYTYQAVTWYFSGDDLARRVRADLPDKHPTYDLLWRMTLAEKRAFLRAALLGDGSQSKSGSESWTFEQKDAADRQWFVTLLALVGWRGHDYARKARDGGSVSLTQHADTTISSAKMKDAVEHYEGEVWCVRVPTGAFVARRRGQIFITGNSGFPKSLDISKAIDASDAVQERRRRALAFTSWMRSTGITAAQVADLSGTRMGSHYLTDAEQPTVATADLFDLLRPHLPPVPPEIEALVRERTVESENMKARAVVGTQRVVDATVRRPCFAGETFGEDGTATRDVAITVPHSPEAVQWAGWGTSLKPAAEHWILARKPLDGTYAENVLRWGVGGLNIDGCRIGSEAMPRTRSDGTMKSGNVSMSGGHAHGRWPANVILSHDPRCVECGDVFACVPGCPVRALDEQSGLMRDGVAVKRRGRKDATPGWGNIGKAAEGSPDVTYGGKGGASRFFYVAKPARSEKDAGLEHLPSRTGGEATGREDGSAGLNSPRAGGGRGGGIKNHHPTPKSIALMRYLVRLICSPGGVVLDVFAGSGTTGIAALAEGCSFVGVERDLDDDTGEIIGYAEVAAGRLRHALEAYPAQDRNIPPELDV